MSSDDTQIRFPGCSCDEHKDIYQNWPWRNAELTVATCMRTCPYCNKSFLTTSNLRNHLKGRAYKARRLTVKHERGGRRAIRRAPARTRNPLTNTDTNSNLEFQAGKSFRQTKPYWEKSECAARGAQLRNPWCYRQITLLRLPRYVPHRLLHRQRPK